MDTHIASIHVLFFFLYSGRHPISTLTDTHFPHTTPSRSPLRNENGSTCGNALRLDWFSICPPMGTGVKMLADDLFGSPIDQAEINFENEKSEEHTSELQSLMRISYAVFCLKKKNNIQTKIKLIAQ